jgi:hypothetical protein
MKLPAYAPRYDWLLQLIIIPLHIGLLNWGLIGSGYWQNWTTFGLATGITVFISFFNWLVNNAIALRLQQWYPKPEQYLIRTAVMSLLCATSSCLHSTLIFGIYSLIGLPGFVPEPFRLGLGLLFTMIIVIIVIATYESIHNFGHWQQSRKEVDTLSKAQLQAQLDVLRHQVNPHFLFNSLNSLIALIGEDPRQAEAFAEELSSVYRYLLRSNECALISLSSELEFIQSYYHLLKTRHGDALNLMTDIEPGARERRLPPLTLQLLIENAVKHNTILPDQPLTIVLRTDDQQRLIVSNNLQRKQTRVLSNGVGLSNILSKYQMLGQEAPIIEDNGREFRVTLPLVQA